jgi:hypothetical protein
MSRRPELIVGDLYHLKAYNEWDWDYESNEYLAKVLQVGEKETDNLSIYVKCAARVFFEIIASTKKDIPLSQLQYDNTTASYPWKQSWVIEYPQTTWRSMPNRIVIQKFNPKKLPLYLNWGYGKDTIIAMLKGDYAYDKPRRTHPAKLAPAP